MPRKKTHSKSTTIRISTKTYKKILRAKKESEYALSSGHVVDKAMDFYLKKDPKKIKWE